MKNSVEECALHPVNKNWGTTGKFNQKAYYSELNYKSNHLPGLEDELEVNNGCRKGR